MGKTDHQKSLSMLLINQLPYINLDSQLPLDTIPKNLIEAISESYDFIKKNTWQKTTLLNGDVSNCNWHIKESGAKCTSDYFGIEVKNQTVAPMWILDLTIDNNKNDTNLYDSLINSPDEWRNIKFRSDLPKSWDPFITWLQNLDCFDHVGRSSLLITRPGIAPQYHRDIGISDCDYKPTPHRQEFIWLKVTDTKNLYILDKKRTPIKVESKSAFFNHHNWHGSHKPLPYWSFSFKIEGVFKQKFRSQLKIDLNDGYD